LLPVSGGVRSLMPVVGHENATSFGLCAAFSRLNGGGQAWVVL